MLADIWKLVVLSFSFLPSYAATRLRQKISAFLHSRTYKSLPSGEVQNVIVIGGSFGGLHAVKRLTETLPTGYRVVLVEKNSHFNYVFAFPRFSVVKGYEHYAFIPYSGFSKSAPKGILLHVQGTVTQVSDRHVELESGEKLAYAYLVIATGTSSALPSKVLSTESEHGQEELRGMQDTIENAGRIAIVGGGAVGVELAGDVKDFYPDKEVTLIHSRGQLLPSFGKRLHDDARKTLTAMGIAVRLNERPSIPRESKVLRFANGEEKEFDLIIPCTGQRPNSSIIANLSPTSISKDSSHILVKPSLHIVDDAFSHIFALGDVAATGGPRMGRAAIFQADVVVENILASIKGLSQFRTYEPNVGIEGAIKLTLGKNRLAIYANLNDGQELLLPLNKGHVDMDVKVHWKYMGADVKQAENDFKAS